MIRKDGKYPANARVDVDYSKGKPKIKFTYPKNGDSPKKQAIKQNNQGPIGLILLILIVAIPIIIIFNDSYSYVDYPEECNVSLDKHYLNVSVYNDRDGYNYSISRYETWVEGANFTCGNKTYLVEFNRYVDKSNLIEEGFIFKSKLSQWEKLNKALTPFYIIILLFILWIIINKRITIYLIKQKWYQKWLPKHQAEGWFKKWKLKKYMKFIPEDVENNIVEIPCFKNIELDYKTEGDFSNKLERIKIREHQYNQYKKGKVGKRKVRLGEWYARFYFKEKPKDGFLEVIFQ